MRARRGDAPPTRASGLVLDHDAALGEPIADPIRFAVVAVTAESVALREQRVNLRGVEIVGRRAPGAREPGLRVGFEQAEQRAARAQAEREPAPLAGVAARVQCARERRAARSARAAC